MSADEQRIAIAEACGFVFSLCRCDWYLKKPGCVELALGSAPSKAAFANYCPDYLNSLDAMHEAEKTLTEDQQEAYSHALSQLIEQRFNCGPVVDRGEDIMVHREFDLLHATAAQRAQAFLQTINPPTK